MTRLRQKMSRLEAIDLLVEAKVVAPEDRGFVLGSKTSIEFAFGGIDAGNDGFFKRADVSRLISYSRMGALL